MQHDFQLLVTFPFAHSRVRDNTDFEKLVWWPPAEERTSRKPVPILVPPTVRGERNSYLDLTHRRVAKVDHFIERAWWQCIRTLISVSTYILTLRFFCRKCDYFVAFAIILSQVRLFCRNCVKSRRNSC